MIEVRFPGGRRVEAVVGSHAVLTDQPVAAGGEDAGPSPFDLFLASLATCAGYYALRFCQERQIGAAGLGVSMEVERDPSQKRVAKLRIAVRLPEGFPERYREAILRAIGQCAVKRHLEEPPAIDLAALPAGDSGTAL